MKKNLIKNIFTSVCVTALIVMILLLIDGFVFNNIREKVMLDEAEEYFQMQEGSKENFEEDIKTFSAENGVIEYYKKKIGIIYSAESLVYCEIAYGLGVSIILGSIVGYTKTVMESKQDKKAVAKKTALIYLVGLVIVDALVGIIDITRGGFDIESIGLYSMLYTIVYVGYFVVKMTIDNKKKSKLNELMNKEE